jgi:hypothetical protein
VRAVCGVSEDVLWHFGLLGMGRLTGEWEG